MPAFTERRAIISAEVPLEHKRQLMRMAAEGDRSLSHEIRRAVREHVQRETDDAQDDADRGGPEARRKPAWLGGFCAGNEPFHPALGDLSPKSNVAD